MMPKLRALRSLCATALAAALVPCAGAAQDAPRDTLDLSTIAVVSGVVTGSGPSDRLVNATVYVPGESYTAITDSLGRYALPLPEGIWMLSVFHPKAEELGLEQPPTSLVTAPMGSNVRLDFTLDPTALGTQVRPYALEAMEVVVRGAMNERRMREGARIDALDRSTLEQRRPTARHIGDLIAGEFAGVRIRQIDPSSLCVQSPRSAMIRSTRGQSSACPGQVAVVLDGLILDDPGVWLAGLDPGSIDRVEFMPALQGTTRFGRYAANGVLFVYTR